MDICGMIVSVNEKKYNKVKDTINNKFINFDFIDTGIYQKHPSDRIKGCYESHLSNLEKFIETEYNYLLICEDDLFLTNKKKLDLKKIIDDVKKIDKDFNLIYLGHRLAFNQDTKFRETNDTNYIKVETNDLHCLIITKNFAQELVKRNKIYGYTQQIDMLIKEYEDFNKHYYALKNQIAYQKDLNQVEQYLGQMFVYTKGYTKEIRWKQILIFTSILIIFFLFILKKYIII